MALTLPLRKCEILPILKIAQTHSRIRLDIKSNPQTMVIPANMDKEIQQNVFKDSILLLIQLFSLLNSYRETIVHLNDQ